MFLLTLDKSSRFSSLSTCPGLAPGLSFEVTVAKRERIKKSVFEKICQLMAEGRSLARICREDAKLPSDRTVPRHIQEDENAYDMYRKAQAVRAERLRDEIIDLIEMPLPDDPKLASAEVNRRRLEADYKDKFIRQVQSQGLRVRKDDSDAPSGITLTWGSSVVEVSQ